jgi:outer membrane protein assembly factor BamB
VNRTSRLMAVLAAVVSLIVLTPGSARAATHGWWHTDGYTVANSGFNPNESAVTVSTVGRLVAQRTTTPDRAGQRAPVLDDGRIFVPDVGAVTAYDEFTGEQLWRYESDHESNSGPAGTPLLVVTDSEVVAGFKVGGGWPYGFAVVVTLDVATGQKLAESPTMDEGISTLLVDRGVVVASDTEARYPFTNAFRLSDLQQLWSNELALRNPVSAGGRLLLRGYHNYAEPRGQYSEIVDIATGAVQHSFVHTWFDALAADEAGTRFYLGWGHSLQVLDAATGVMTWLASNVYPAYGSLSPTRLYVATTDNKVRVFDAKTGGAFWTRDFPGRLAKPIIAGGVLYVTLPGDRVHALNPVTGVSLAAPTFTGSVAHPVVTNGKVYVTNGVRLTTYGL